MRMLGNVLQTGPRGQFVLDFLHDEIGEVLHALGGAAHAHELRNKYCKHLFMKNKENLTLDGRWTRQKVSEWPIKVRASEDLTLIDLLFLCLS